MPPEPPPIMPPLPVPAVPLIIPYFVFHIIAGPYSSVTSPVLGSTSTSVAGLPALSSRRT